MGCSGTTIFRSWFTKLALANAQLLVRFGSSTNETNLTITKFTNLFVYCNYFILMKFSILN